MNIPAQPNAPELSKPQRKILSSLGHHITRLAAACEKLLIRAEKYPGLKPWLSASTEAQKSLLIGPGTFACPIILDGEKLHFFSHGNTREKGINPHGAGAPLPSHNIPFRNSPLWPALLRLRPLREFWERELRRATLEALLDLYPDAWLLDPAPLPPGAVIPQLDIPSWNEFNPASYSTRNFLPATTAEIHDRLSSFPTFPGVLMSFPKPSPGAQKFLSLYQNENNRVEWQGMVRLQPRADGQK